MSSSSDSPQLDTAQYRTSGTSSTSSLNHSVEKILEQIADSGPVLIQVRCSHLPTQQAWIAACEELRALGSPTIDIQARGLDAPDASRAHLLISDHSSRSATSFNRPLVTLWIQSPPSDDIQHVATELTATSKLVAPDELTLPGEFLVPSGIEAPGRQRLLRWLLSQVAQRQAILELHQRWQQAERLAEIDDLTQLPNRRAWWREFPRRLTAARQQHQPLSIVLFDLQQFKQVNDRLGLSVGDHLLVTLARNWQAACRSDEFLARIGGDEFACLLPLVDAKSLFDRLTTIVPQITTPQPLTELLPANTSTTANAPHSNLPSLPALRVHRAATPCVDDSATPAELWSIVEQELLRSKTGATTTATTDRK